MSLPVKLSTLHWCGVVPSSDFCRDWAILLDETSEFNAKPELEIYADDVKCSHGSASGSLDDNSIFYLMSRGLNYKQAKGLLINGFLLDVIEKITDAEIKDLLKKMIGLKKWT